MPTRTFYNFSQEITSPRTHQDNKMRMKGTLKADANASKIAQPKKKSVIRTTASTTK